MTSKMAIGLIRSAAQRAPEALSERLAEEWLADLIAQSGPISRLRFALGCFWAARVIARQNLTPVPPSTDADIGPNRAHFIRFPQGPSPVLMSGATSFLLILALNTAVLYGLILGLSHS